MPEQPGQNCFLWVRGWIRQRWWACIAGSIIACLLLAAAPASRAADWKLYPYLQLAGGHESALLLDPGGAAVLVPGGNFLDLTPTLTLQSQFGPRNFLQLGTSAGLERFFNEAQRLLYAQTLWMDYTYRLSAPTRWRISLNGNYFNDTEQSTLRRWQGGAETGLGFYRRTWSLEAFVGGTEVTYPKVDSVDSAGNPIEYRETRWNLGLTGALRPLPTLQFLANLVGRDTDSVLRDYDSRSALVELSLRWAPARFWRVDAYYGAQWRHFDNRAAGFDEDQYLQWGLGLGRRLTRDVELRVRWSDGNYVDTFDQDQPTDRFELALELGPAVFGVKSSPVPFLPPVEPTDPSLLLDSRGTRFRLHAPAAGSVAVVGDFNGWDPGQDPLQAVGDGWWELFLPLDPGSYQYLYLVDGKTVVPPESRVTVDDGFGGRNGLIEVFSPIP
jgi:hypothetical protein